MPRNRKHHCRHCGGHDSEVGRISARGRCWACGNERLAANHRELISHSGPFFEHWRRRTLAAFGVVSLDSDRDAA